MSKMQEKHEVRVDSKGNRKEEHIVKRSGEYAEGGEKAPGLLDKAADFARDAWDATKDAVNKTTEAIQESFAPSNEGQEVHREVHRVGPHGECIVKEDKSVAPKPEGKVIREVTREGPHGERIEKKEVRRV